MAAKARIAGAPVSMGGEDWIVPALSFRQLRELKEPLGRLASGIDLNVSQDDVVVVVHAALSRNYPDLTCERVESELLDLSNMKEAIEAVMGQSGMVKRGAEGEA